MNIDLDIDRLHEESVGRGSGRTTKMLVEAIQNADFVEPHTTFRVFGHNHQFARRLAHEAAWVATMLDFEEVHLVRDVTLKVNNVTYQFYGMESPSRTCIGWKEENCFYDHFALGEE